MAKFSTIARVLDVDLPALERLTADELNRTLTTHLAQQIQTVMQLARQHYGGEWEVMSVNIVPIGPRLVATYLIVRPDKNTMGLPAHP